MDTSAALVILQANEHEFDHDQQTTQIAVNGGEDEFAFNPTKGTSEVSKEAHETIEHNQEISLEEVRRGSNAVDQSMEEIRIKMETFTDMVRIHIFPSILEGLLVRISERR